VGDTTREFPSKDKALILRRRAERWHEQDERIGAYWEGKDSAGVWSVGLYHEGQERRLGSFPNKTKARKVYEKQIE